MRYLSVCSGIEAATVAWHPLGWEPVAFAEIDPFACAVLEHHYPSVPNLGDMNNITMEMISELLECKHAKPQKRVPGSDHDVSGGDVAGGDIAILRDNPSIHVGVDAPSPHSDEAATQTCGEQSLLQGDSGRQASDSSGREGCGRRSPDEADDMPTVRKSAGIQKREGRHRGASRGLQQAAACHVAVPEVPSSASCGQGGIDLVVAGFPCQDLSVAGLRKGLVDDAGNTTRSGLFFAIARLCDRLGQRWTLLENVPGLLSSHKGRDFAVVVGTLVGADVDIPDGGWRNTGVAVGPKGLVEWCVLDAQWFGVPQRRRRVFIIRDSGNWQDRPPVLFERDCLSGNPPPSREAGKGVARDVAACLNSGGNNGGFRTEPGEHLVAFGGNNTSGPIAAAAVNAKGGAGRMDFETETSVVGPLCSHSAEHGHAMTTQQAVDAGQIVPVAFHARQDPDVPGEVTHPLDTDGGTNVVAFQDVAQPIRSNGYNNSDPGMEARMHVQHGMHVRRLLPVECCRLQGFPSIINRITVNLCLDHQKTDVLAAIRCRRSQGDALPVCGEEIPAFARSADLHLWSDLESRAAPVAVHVRLLRETPVVLLRSLGKWYSLASSVGPQNSSPHPMPSGGSAQAVAHTWHTLGAAIRTGGAESQESSRGFILQENGGWHVAGYGLESMATVSDAIDISSEVPSIISNHGQRTGAYDLKAATLLCSALNAIGSYIPERTSRPSSFSIVVDIETDYLDIIYRGKPAADGPRYRALGNSMAVPVMRWIGERIDKVRLLTGER